mgnify:FL=1
MINGKDLRPRDMGNMSEQLIELTVADLKPLPAPFDKPEMEPGFKAPKADWNEKYNSELDGFIAIDTFLRPQTQEEKDELVQKFLRGVEKMLSCDTNGGIMQVLNLTMEYCAKCNTCSNACHIFEASNRNELYRPTYRAEVLRMIVKKYFDKNGKLIPGGKNDVVVKFIGGDIDLNWETVARLGELSYRCNLCRRCAQTCPLALDNGLIAREIRKIFSQELGYAPKPLHEKGTQLQLKTGSSTGMSKVPFLDTVEFLDEDATDLFGEGTTEYKTPMDVEGADILLLHNAGEFNAWPENPMAFTMLFQEAGLSWTLSSDICGYDNVNYGLWYDDAQCKKVAIKQNEVAKKLGVKRIVIAECGHAHKAAAIMADRYYPGSDRVTGQSFLPLMRDLVKAGTYKIDPNRNDFPVVLHDPCNYVRQMGIVKPQRDILKMIMKPGHYGNMGLPYYEMKDHGVNNYCCGGGSGFAIMQSMSFPQWRNNIAHRKKLEQILEAFGPEVMENTDVPKYICAPCSNCKGAMRDIIEHYRLDRFNVHYGGLVELIVNAMTKYSTPYMEFLRDE